VSDRQEIQSRLSERAASPDFLERLAERVGLASQARAVFGEPVERDGITVIPVAKARWGFGGGSGDNAEGRGVGGGGGGGVTPLGYIELRDGSARFKRIRDPRLGGALAVALAASAAVALRSIR
jgi:uncharacterized spore protein YtfJ